VQYPQQHLGILYWMIHQSERTHKYAEILGRQLGVRLLTDMQVPWQHTEQLATLPW